MTRQMNQKPQISHKQILSDPVSAFRSLHSVPDAGKLAALESISQQASALKQQHKDNQEQAKILSRKIGEAKRSGQSIDELKLAMQKQSGILSQLTASLNDTENQILQFFEPDTARPDTKQTVEIINKEPNSANRIYPAAVDRLNDISIELMHGEDTAWNTYVLNNPAATIHHRTEWRDLLQESYAIESFYFVAHDAENNIVGILPLTHLKSRLFGNMFVSMPWFQRGGAVADHPSIEQKLMQAAQRHAATLGVDHIEYRDDISRQALPVQSHKVNMVLQLPDSSDALWSGFSAKLRAQIRRPQREHPEIQLGNKQLLNDFYSVYSRNMRDLGSPAHSKQFVANILDSFPEHSWIIVLRLNNRPVAAGLLLSQGNYMEIPLASTIRDVNPLSMNMLLYWEVLKFATDKGFRYFDFGRSSIDAGTRRFKQQWGAQPKQLYWHYWLSKGANPSLNPSNPKYALVIYIWKRLPVFLTNWLGPKLVKNLP